VCREFRRDVIDVAVDGGLIVDIRDSFVHNLNASRQREQACDRVIWSRVLQFSKLKVLDRLRISFIGRRVVLYSA
jgi:hypothetical protein